MPERVHLDLEKMPEIEKQLLCQILDQEESWKQLGKLMQFSAFDIAIMSSEANRLRKSPSNVIISKWSLRYGHNVTELFKLLSDMQSFLAMDSIKHLVDPAYHVWFKSKKAEENEHGKKLNVQHKSQLFQKDQQPKETFREPLKELITVPECDLEELKWDATKRLGKGGFGEVFFGEYLSTKVAIKKLDSVRDRSTSYTKDRAPSLNELQILSRVRHDNIVEVFCYAIQEDKTCLMVFKLMPGKSLDDRLFEPTTHEPLTWPERWRIAIGIARGLNYCHQYDKGKPLIHADIKPGNILLDMKCEPKLCDFGHSYEAQSRDVNVLTMRFGTKGYMAPEFLEGGLMSTKIDVFSFGVVLLELATGFKALADKANKSRIHYELLYKHIVQLDATSNEAIASIMDRSPKHSDQACFNLCKLMVNLGKQCTVLNPNFRPDIIDVYQSLISFVPDVVSYTATPMLLFAP